jgi:hypothetical protein
MIELLSCSAFCGVLGFPVVDLISCCSVQLLIYSAVHLFSLFLNSYSAVHNIGEATGCTLYLHCH